MRIFVLLLGLAVSTCVAWLKRLTDLTGSFEAGRLCYVAPFLRNCWCLLEQLMFFFCFARSGRAGLAVGSMLGQSAEQWVLFNMLELTYPDPFMRIVLILF